MFQPDMLVTVAQLQHQDRLQRAEANRVYGQKKSPISRLLAGLALISQKLLMGF